MTEAPGDVARRPSGTRTVRTERALVELTATGLPRRFDVAGLSLLLHPASDLEDGLTQLWLRLPDGHAPRPLLGSRSGGTLHRTPDGPVVVTEHPHGVTARAGLRLGEDTASWFWHVELTATEAVDCDLVAVQDLALAPYDAVRTNEYYVCQYLDHTPVEVAGHGTALAVRQNMPGARQPWALVGGLHVVVGWATDALQLTGRGRLDGEPLPGLLGDLPSRRLQHEHGVQALQTAAIALRPGTPVRTGFWGLLLDDHPAATGPEDARWAAVALADPAAAGLRGTVADAPPEPVPASVFSSVPVLRCRELPDDHVPATGVVTAQDQRAVLRPHGHLLRTGSALVPDERTVTCTSWMAGSFWSQVTQGHTSRGGILSLRRGYLGLQQAHGLRVIVAPPGGDTADHRLLGVPTRWTTTPGGCRWEYLTEQQDQDRGLPSRVVVEVEAPTDAHQLRFSLTADRPVRLLAALHLVGEGDDGALPGAVAAQQDPAGASIAVGTGTVRLDWPERSVTAVAGSAALQTGTGTATGMGELPWLVLTVPETDRWSLALTPDLLPVDEIVVPAARSGAGADDLDPGFWQRISAAVTLHADAGGDSAGNDGVDGSGAGHAAAAELHRIGEILPWYAHDALVHYLSPRGLEQFSGGAWGTRDVCQGPVGLLLALGDHTALREVCVQVLRAQHVRGDWPQWFEMYDHLVDPEQRDAHGDVVYWPLLAVGEYLAASADAGLLDVELPFVGDGELGAPDSVVAHLTAALDHVDSTLVPGTSLPAYGHGDWNDSLQPADPALAAALCSTWTAVLQTHALRTLADGLTATGSDDPRVSGLVGRCRTLADAGASELLELLQADGVLAGYGLFDDAPQRDDRHGAGHSGAVRPSALLVHPRDTRTGLRWSILPMIHAISGRLLDPASARHHLDVIAEHLTGPDGARLFDAPVAYHGGPMEVFQRAEAATFFGREIGIMYTHAHLRHAEALAHVGDGPGLLRGLALANPIGITERVPAARPRQQTTYFSSSDAAFADRAEAAAGYAGVLDGSVALEGGWRVYSSGPGLYLRLVTEQLLGIRHRAGVVEIDPVLDPALGVVTATVPVAGRSLRLRCVPGERGHGVTGVSADGRPLTTSLLENPYRAAGVAVAAADLLALLDGTDGAVVTVTLG